MPLRNILIIGALVLVSLAYAYDWRTDRAPVLSPVPYSPQGLLWVDDHLEQTTWWGDGAIIQSTH